MNCQQIQRRLLESDESAWPVELQQHLGQCANCRKTWEQTLRLRQLIGLKRYEQAPPGLDEKCAVDVIHRLKTGETSTESLSERWQDFLAWPETRASLALAAAALILLAAGLLWITGRLDGSRHSTKSLANSSTNLTTDQELPANQMLDRLSITNIDPTRIEYGAQPSRVVDFEEK
ncbi:MAG TPA: hypothetical protein DCZ95_15380 [Verrucomicrobia bacterium]|nr:MAG: hypothetical protein A2X46_19135 [Lentisphaerae bacterium GWF2_57_35]HBA85467.1 hypothetical protein [Verrucomicrobiota bacterium]